MRVLRFLVLMILFSCVFLIPGVSKVSADAKFVAHAGGASFDNPEIPPNSVKAFEIAGKSNVWGIETDVWITKDGELICLHGPRLKANTTETSSKRPYDVDYNYIKKLYLIRNDGKKTKQRVPTFDEYIKICKKYNKVAYVELKKYNSEKERKAVITKVLAKLKSYGYLNKSVIISNGDEAAERIDNLKVTRQKNKSIPLGYITNSSFTKTNINTIRTRMRKINITNNYMINGGAITKPVLDYVHGLGIKVSTRRVNSLADVKKYNDIGVDYFSTDRALLSVNYKITYNLNGGSVSGNPTTYNIDSGKITLKNPTKAGYVFAGWTGTDLSSKTKTVTIPKGSRGNKEYTATWTPNKIYIKMNMNGGQLSSNHGSTIGVSGNFVTLNSSQIIHTINYGGKLGTSGLSNYNNPNYINIVKKGYGAISKNEWKTQDGSKTYNQATVYKASDFCDASAGNCTSVLYVNWDKTNYKINYDLKGGTVTSNPITYNIDSDSITLNNPIRDGYKFSGWTGTGLSSKAKTVTIPKGSTGNKSYVANWDANSYPITYDLKGGIANGNPTTYNTDTNTITLKNPSKIGYTFTGWTGSNGNTPQVSVSIPKGSMENKSYVANWTANNYTITYELNDGSVSGNPTTYNTDTDTITLKNPSKIGYTFTGWTGTDLSAKTMTVTIPKGATGNKKYTANWTPNKIYIKMNMNGGVPSNDHGSTIGVSDGFVTLNDSQNIHTINYGDKLGTSGLANYNNSNYINILKNGYKAASKNEWKTQNGSKTYNQDTVYNASDFCDASAGNCTLVLYVNWIPEQYKINYDLKEGTVTNNPTSYNIESNDIVLNNPLKNGYTFTGWTGSNGNTPQTTVNISKGTTGNKSYTANYSVNIYTITFNSNGGSSVHNIEVGYGSEVIKPNDPIKEGHSFAGWYSDEGLTNLYSFTTMPSENITLYAKWTENENEKTIKYELNGGINNEYNPTIYTPGQEKTLLEPTKTGHKFLGWYLDDHYTQAIEKITSDMTGDITLYAKFEKKEYTITFNSNGGSSVNSIAENYGKNITAPEDPEKEGYKFMGWYSDEGLNTIYKFDKMPAQNIVLYAKWEKNTYNVDFDTNGGTSLLPILVKYGDKVIKPVNPDKKGYTFKGWYSNNNFTEIYNFENAVHSDITLHAKWEKNTYKVEYDTDGAGQIETQNILYENDIPKPTNPVKKGYVFLGWFTVDNDEYVFGKMPAYNLTLYAKWRPDNYTITFNSNGGSVVNPIEKRYGEEIIEPNMPSKQNYKFAGWYSDEELTNLYTFSTMPNENITLYAKWAINESIIRYELNGGKNSEDNPTTYLPGDGKVLKDPTREGYKFVGWYSDKDYQDKVNSLNDVSGDITLYAKWNVNRYTISFDSNGGSTVNPVEMQYEEDVSESPEPVKNGYKFAGWYSDEELTKLFTFGTMPSENITLYAKWTVNENVIRYELNGGENSEDNPTTYMFGEERVLKDATRDDYVFLGWYSDEDFQNKVEKITADMNGDITLYARWSFKAHTITFNSNLGSKVDDITAIYKETIPSPESPVKEGYRFAGWYSDEGLTNEYTFDTMPNENITLYAKWAKITKYTLSFNSNGGSAVNKIIGEDGMTVFEPNYPYKENYKFAGWYSDAALTKLYSFTVMPDDNITLYAKWVSNSANVIHYNTNGGLNDPANPTSYMTGQEIVLKAAKKDGYEFLGWYLDENYTKKIEKITSDMSEDIALYAKFSKGMKVKAPYTGSEIPLLLIIGGLLLIIISVQKICSISGVDILKRLRKK